MEEKLFYDSFDEYAKDYPVGEMYRSWLTGVATLKRRINKKVKYKHPPKPVLLIKSNGEDHGIIGGYLWAQKIRYVKGGIAIALHDCDDKLMVRNCGSEQEADEWLENLKVLAPFDMKDMEAFGFVREN